MGPPASLHYFLNSSDKQKGKAEFLSVSFSAKVLGISYSRILPWRGFFGIIAVNAVFAIVFLGINNVLSGTEAFGNMYLRMVVLGLLWTIVYFAVMIKNLKSYGTNSIAFRGERND